MGVGEGKILMGDKNEVSDHKYHAKECGLYFCSKSGNISSA